MIKGKIMTLCTNEWSHICSPNLSFVERSTASRKVIHAEEASEAGSETVSAQRVNAVHSTISRILSGLLRMRFQQAA